MVSVHRTLSGMRTGMASVRTAVSGLVPRFAPARAGRRCPVWARVSESRLEPCRKPVPAPRSAVPVGCGLAAPRAAQPVQCGLAVPRKRRPDSAPLAAAQLDSTNTQQGQVFLSQLLHGVDPHTLQGALAEYPDLEEVDPEYAEAWLQGAKSCLRVDFSDLQVVEDERCLAPHAFLRPHAVPRVSLTALPAPAALQAALRRHPWLLLADPQAMGAAASALSRVLSISLPEVRGDAARRPRHAPLLLQHGPLPLSGLQPSLQPYESSQPVTASTCTPLCVTRARTSLARLRAGVAGVVGQP
jgi:hypothetical protein